MCVAVQDIFGSKPPKPPALPPMPASTPAGLDKSRKAVAAAKQAETETQRKRKASASTILTGPRGIQEEVPVSRKRLLGQ
jgi:hypothetical protein